MSPICGIFLLANRQKHLQRLGCNSGRVQQWEVAVGVAIMGGSSRGVAIMGGCSSRRVK